MDPILEAVEGLGKKIESKSENTTKEIEKLSSDLVKQTNEFRDEVKKLNEDMAKKDATILDLQNGYKELKGKRSDLFGGGKPTDLKLMLAETIQEHKEAIIKTEKGGLIAPIELKVVGNISSANLTGTGNNYVSYLDWRPGMEPLGQYHFRNLVRTINSETDYVRFPRANTPIGEGSFARVAEGATKPQVDRDYTMVDLTLQTIAGYAIVSRQALRNITFLREWLPTSMMEQLEDTEDVLFANSLVAAASGSTSTSGITNGTTNLGKIVAYITRLIAGKYTPNAIVMDPAAWASIMLNTETNAGFNLPNIVTVDTQGNTRILGIPVIPVNWLSGGRMIVGDWRKAAIVQSEGLTLRQSDSHASIFTSNEVAFLLERVEELAIFRPAAFTTAVF